MAGNSVGGGDAPGGCLHGRAARRAFQERFSNCVYIYGDRFPYHARSDAGPQYYQRRGQVHYSSGRDDNFKCDERLGYYI